jgi:hypothetical protein
MHERRGGPCGFQANLDVSLWVTHDADQKFQGRDPAANDLLDGLDGLLALELTCQRLARTPRPRFSSSTWPWSTSHRKVLLISLKFFDSVRARASVLQDDALSMLQRRGAADCPRRMPST